MSVCVNITRLDGSQWSASLTSETRELDLVWRGGHCSGCYSDPVFFVTSVLCVLSLLSCHHPTAPPSFTWNPHTKSVKWRGCTTQLHEKEIFCTHSFISKCAILEYFTHLVLYACVKVQCVLLSSTSTGKNIILLQDFSCKDPPTDADIW